MFFSAFFSLTVAERKKTSWLHTKNDLAQFVHVGRPENEFLLFSPLIFARKKKEIGLKWREQNNPFGPPLFPMLSTYMNRLVRKNYERIFPRSQKEITNATFPEKTNYI